MSKIARRISVISRQSDGSVQVETMSPKIRSRKSSRWLKDAERMERHVLRAYKVYAGKLLELHERSSRRRRDGWVTGALKNVYKAEKKAWPELRKASFGVLPKR